MTRQEQNQLPKPKYTLGFISYKKHILLLNRQKAPWMGRWNGVGGKIDFGESPYDCIVRETLEETGLKLPNYEPRGIIRWRRDGIDLGGAYLFSAEVSEEVFASYETPKVFCHEGILDWKTFAWIHDKDNTGVVDNVQIMLRTLFECCKISVWTASYEGSTMISCDYTEEEV